MVFIALGVMLLTDQAFICLVTLIAAALHELGHLLMARCLKIPTRCLRLELLGARIEVDGYLLSYGEEWLLCAAGPLVSLFFSAIAAPFWSVFSTARIFSCVSLVLGLLNLLPIQSFDGGRMLACFLAVFLTPRSTYRCIRLISFFFLFLLWSTAVYFLLLAGDGLSLLCFSIGIFLRFFEEEAGLGSG